jgi:hypothetical protein
MENSLYYTFSTIPQILSAFIALSGVFLIFKIQEFKKMQFLQVQHFYAYLNGVSGMIIGSFHDCPTIAVTLKTLHKSECLGGMLKEMDSILEDSNVKKAPELKSLTRMRNTFKNIDKVRKQLLLLAKISIISGIFTIFLSVSILPFVSQISCNQSIILYVIGLLGTLLSIVTMTVTIFKSFREKNLISLKKPSR